MAFLFSNESIRFVSLMIRINYVMADDEPLYLELLTQYLEGVPGLQCIGRCQHAQEVLAVLQSEEPDLLILDVEMPTLNGLQLVRSLRKLPYVIFISSHPEYAMDAFDVDAVDFIKKPIPPERLLRAIEKVKHLMTVKQAMADMESFKPSGTDGFFIREDNTYARIRHDDVLYIESLTDFVKIHLLDGSEKLALVNLKNMEQQLPSGKFLRISRSYIIHKEKVTAVSNEGVQLGKIHLPIGVTYTEKVVQHIIGQSAIKRHL